MVGSRVVLVVSSGETVVVSNKVVVVVGPAVVVVVKLGNSTCTKYWQPDAK